MRYHNTNRTGQRSGQWHFGSRSHLYWHLSDRCRFNVELVPSRGLTIWLGRLSVAYYWWEFDQSNAGLWST